MPTRQWMNDEDDMSHVAYQIHQFNIGNIDWEFDENDFPVAVDSNDRDYETDDQDYSNDDQDNSNDDLEQMTKEELVNTLKKQNAILSSVKQSMAAQAIKFDASFVSYLKSVLTDIKDDLAS